MCGYEGGWGGGGAPGYSQIHNHLKERFYFLLQGCTDMCYDICPGMLLRTPAVDGAMASRLVLTYPEVPEGATVEPVLSMSAGTATTGVLNYFHHPLH